MDNAKYHSRFVEKSRTMNMRKMIFMIKHHIEIPLSLPVKPVLLQKICEANILKKYVVDEMTLYAGYCPKIASISLCDTCKPTFKNPTMIISI